MQIYGLTAGGNISEFAKTLGIPVYEFANRPCACIMHAQDVSLEFGSADQNYRPYMSLTGEIIKVKLGDLDGQLDEPSAVWFRDGEGIPSRVIYDFSEDELINMVRSGMYDGNDMQVPSEFQTGDYTFVYAVSGQVVLHRDDAGKMIPLVHLRVSDSINKELNQENCLYHFGMQCYSPEMWAEMQKQNESHDDYVYGEVFTDYADVHGLDDAHSENVLQLNHESEPINMEFDAMFEAAMQNDAEMFAMAGASSDDPSAVLHRPVPLFQFVSPEFASVDKEPITTDDNAAVDNAADFENDDLFAAAFNSLSKQSVVGAPADLDLSLKDEQNGQNDGDSSDFDDWIGAGDSEDQLISESVTRASESAESEVMEPVFIKPETIESEIVESTSIEPDVIESAFIESEVMEPVHIEPETTEHTLSVSAHTMDETDCYLSSVADNAPISVQDVVRLCADMRLEQAVRFIKQNASRIDLSEDDDTQYGD